MDQQREPIYYLILLDGAIARGDLQAAAKYQRDLERLGVSVRYRRPSIALSHEAGNASKEDADGR